jgi:hypothetical protein
MGIYGRVAGNYRMHKTGNVARVMITPAQCRSARAMVEMSRDGLSAAARVAARTIADFESGNRQPIPATLAALQAALESAGIIFIPENGDGPGVKLRKAK